MSCGEEGDVVRVVRDDRASPETNDSGDDEGIDRRLASHVCCGEQMAGDTGHPRSGGHDLGEPPSEKLIDGLVGPSSSIELHQHSRRNSNRHVPGVGTSQGGPDELVASGALVWSGERRDRLAVQD